MTHLMLIRRRRAMENPARYTRHVAKSLRNTMIMSVNMKCLRFKKKNGEILKHILCFSAAVEASVSPGTSVASSPQSLIAAMVTSMTAQF